MRRWVFGVGSLLLCAGRSSGSEGAGAPCGSPVTAASDSGHSPAQVDAGLGGSGNAAESSANNGAVSRCSEDWTQELVIGAFEHKATQGSIPWGYAFTADCRLCMTFTADMKYVSYDTTWWSMWDAKTSQIRVYMRGESNGEVRSVFIGNLSADGKTLEAMGSSEGHRASAICNGVTLVP